MVTLKYCKYLNNTTHKKGLVCFAFWWTHKFFGTCDVELKCTFCKLKS